MRNSPENKKGMAPPSGFARSTGPARGRTGRAAKPSRSATDVSAKRLSTSSLIFGTQRFTTLHEPLHEDVLHSAHEWIHLKHTAQCHHSTPKYFASMASAGIGNDLNQAVRSLAIAFYRGRQLVLLPPRGGHRSKLSPDTQKTLDIYHPWHWLQNAPLTAILRPSSCQALMTGEFAAASAALSDAAPEVPAAKVFRTLGLLGLANSSVSQSTNHWRVGLEGGFIPQQFRSMGLLWWFQALTTYFIRFRKPLRQRLLGHPALAQLMRTLPLTAQELRPGSDSALKHATCAAPSGAQRCYGINLLPNIAFDIGLHIRLGDACRPELRRTKTKSRTCFENISDALELLRERGHTEGAVFLATDSQAIVSQVEAGAAAPFTFHYLNISRSRYDTALPNELRATNRMQDLIDMLLDVLLLSHSTVISGTMQSNVPRLAMQLRVQPPGAFPISLDRREWCTRSSCRMNYTKQFGTAR